VPSFTLEKLVNGDYARQWEEYINDHFIFRNKWVELKTLSEIGTGKTEVNGVYIGKDGYLFQKYERNFSNLELAAKSIDTFAAKQEIPTYFMLVPNSIEIYKENLPNFALEPVQEADIRKLYSTIEHAKPINTIDLIKRTKQEEIYYKTDHHMTSRGAYLLYLSYCKEAGITPEVDFTEKEVSNSFLGTFDSKARLPNQTPDRITVFENKHNTDLREVIYDTGTSKNIYNEEYLSQKDKYSYFLNGNNSKVVIKTKVENGQKLLIIKDSYAHNVAQFLCSNYEEIHLIDPRYYHLNLTEYAKENGITVNLVLYNYENLFSDLGVRGIK